MDRIWMEQATLIKRGESFVVATVVDKAGSAPRGSGAKMIVRKSGQIIGTIGGGSLEAKAIERALAAFDQKDCRLHPFNLTGKDAAETEMICGGAGEILIDYVDAKDKVAASVFSTLEVCIQRREKCWLVTSVGPGGFRERCLIEGDRSILGDLRCSDELAEKLRSGPSKFSIHSEVLGDRRIFVEPIREQGTVVLFGAGHVAKCVAPIAESVGFRTIVIDDRGDFACVERFPHARLIVPASLDQRLPPLDLDGDSYLVIVTRGHVHDRDILEQVIDAPVAYIGMIGSRRKRDMVYKYLMEERGVSQERISFVHSPIGLDIQAETPEEIAISVVAELIQIRSEREHGQ